MDKDLLFKPRLPEEEMQIPGIGTIRVRGLNRAEAMAIEAAKGIEAKERKIIAFGMVEPQLTESEAGQWQRACPAGELEPVTTKIAQLSGMLPDSAKLAYREFEDDPGSEFRILPGAEAGDDRGAATGGSE